MRTTTTHDTAPDAAGQAGELMAAIRARHLCITDTDFDEVEDRPVSFDYCEWCGTDMDWPCETILLLDTIDALQARCAAAERERDALVEVLHEWREAEADESGSLAASCRRDGAYAGMIDAIDAYVWEGGYPGEPDLMADALDRMAAASPPPAERGSE